MDKVKNYREEKDKLLLNLENIVRESIKSITKNEYAAKHLPFFGDGLANPEVWFNSNYRPLFILKEVNMGLKSQSYEELESSLESYNRKWGIGPNRYYMEFVEDKFGDIRIGKFNTWKKVVRLSSGLENDFATQGHLKVSFNVEYGDPVTLEYLNYIHRNLKKETVPSAYCEKGSWYKYTTGNKNYINAVNHIAVINIKKIGAGDNTDSFISKSGLDYIWYLSNTSSFLREQIKLLNPTVIISCCGGDNSEIKGELYKEMNHIRWLNTIHPGNRYKSYEDFYNSLRE